MLFIRGKVVGINDSILINEFGRSDRWSDLLGDWIEDLINDSAGNYFNSVAEMRREFLSMNRNNPLPIRFAHPNYNATDITMTGSRRNDEQAANFNLGLAATPAGYTWHHCEGIWKVGNKWKCRMILIRSRYHNRFHHQGGVHEYQQMTNTVYQ